MTNYQLKAGAYHLQLKEIKKLFFSTTSFRDCCLLKSLFCAGLRREEVTTLDVKDIDFDRKHFRAEVRAIRPEPCQSSMTNYLMI